MFSLASGMYDSYFAAPQLNVLIIGCEAVGKTALLERLKVTEFSTKPPRNNVGTRRINCPAPKRYAQAGADDHDETMIGNGVASEGDANQNGSLHVLFHETSTGGSENTPWEAPKQIQDLEPGINGDHIEFNVKKGCSMLPMAKIRPTSGTNLAKVSICGCKCSFFDVSGKFQDIWAKYYGDADAVIFCWRLEMNHAEQRKVLENVRRQIQDEIPVLIFGHVMIAIPEKALPTSTSFFIPHYTSNMMQVYCGSAKTGKGVREAIEWLIPLAKR